MAIRNLHAGLIPCPSVCLSFCLSVCLSVVGCFFLSPVCAPLKKCSREEEHVRTHDKKNMTSGTKTGKRAKGRASSLVVGERVRPKGARAAWLLKSERAAWPGVRAKGRASSLAIEERASL